MCGSSSRSSGRGRSCKGGRTRQETGIRGGRAAAEQELPVGVHKHQVIDVATVVPHLQRPLHKLVERIQIDVSKKLRGEVPYRKPAKGPRMAERLVLGPAVPGGPWTSKNDPFQRVVKDDLLQKIQAKVLGGDSLVGVAVKSFLYKRKEDSPVDVHKKARTFWPEPLSTLHTPLST